MPPVEDHIAAIHELLAAGDHAGIPLWLENGWGIDALLGQVSREHEDIDIAYPEEEHDRIIALISSLGYVIRESTDYGFIATRGDIELDMDRCVRMGDEYTFADYPPGCCPLNPIGTVGGVAVRCVTWDAMYLEMLANRREIPSSQWRQKDHESFSLITSRISADRKQELRAYDASRERTCK